MFYCNHLIHPFLNDPGTSQSQRVSNDLLINPPQIDNRKMADLLNYFTQLAKQINFYDRDLSVSDWQKFFQGSLPFLLSDIAGHNAELLNQKLDAYSRKFKKRPGISGLQLFFFQTYFSAIYPIHQWAIQLDDSGLDLDKDLQKLIKDRLAQPIKAYIKWMNTAVHCFKISPVDVTELGNAAVWQLETTDMYEFFEDFSCTKKSTRAQLLSLQSAVAGLMSAFTGVIAKIAGGAASLVNGDFYSLLQTSGEHDVSPHLALLFSFLNQFQLVQGDLNKFTRSHLDYFFQKVVRLKPSDTVPDQAYIIFNIQQQLGQFLLKAGRPLKDGKDNRQGDIIFGLNEDIVVNQAQIADVRTLFLNNQTVKSRKYVEGVYMAIDATKADGIIQPFKDPANASWPTLGNRLSSYVPPAATDFVPYPSARIGFILTSKVLLMNEGKRVVNINLVCKWEHLCKTNGDGQPENMISGLDEAGFFGRLSAAFSETYILVTQPLIDAALAQGITKESATYLRRLFLTDTCRQSICFDDVVYFKDSAIITKDNFDAAIKNAVGTNKIQQWEANVIELIFLPQQVFNILFSGDKNWIVPDSIDQLQLNPIDTASGQFLINIQATINADQPSPITFYNKDKLGEDFNTTDPLVKIQLNDALKIDGQDLLYDLEKDNNKNCCLYKPIDYCGRQISFYEFFRDVKLLDSVTVFDGEFSSTIETNINVTVCGVQKNIIVNNDDNILDASKPFAPFGVKPVVADFDIFPLHDAPLTDPSFNLVGPNFYIGSTEVFLKKWDKVCVNINWKDLPSNLYNYYETYFTSSALDTTTTKWAPADFPFHEAHLAVLQEGIWQPDNGNYKNSDNSADSKKNTVTGDFNRPLFSTGDAVDACDDAKDYKYSYEFSPADFGPDDGLDLSFDKYFSPVPTKYKPGTMNGFVRVTLENQDFLHKIYPAVLAAQVVVKASDTKAPLPNEPWTPMIQNMSIDYQATATIKDINLIQLYPYNSTYKSVDKSAQPSLFASFCDEGTVFIGLKNLVPGDILNILFKLAEATADSEETPETVNWQYLSSNQWKDLREGFELLDDKTNNLTATGILKLALPDDINKANTVMPPANHWIRASVPINSKATSQIIAIFTQAVLATFINDTELNDQARPGTALPAGSLSKLQVPDAAVTKVIQPYDSFGGKAPEASVNAYYLRVSEQLRHKGRAIQKWDYERIVLQQFPKILRAKCINHTYFLNSHLFKKDFPMAPGNILLAVLPDTNQLSVANAYQPAVPVSMLEEITAYFSSRTSTFVRLFVKNPRYEPINFCIEVKFKEGKDENFYSEQLTLDIEGFFAPWLNGRMEDFQFAQRIYLSAIVSFIESRDYIDYIFELRMSRDGEPMADTAPAYIDPLTPRSILVAGSIEVRPVSRDNVGDIQKTCSNEPRYLIDYSSHKK